MMFDNIFHFQIRKWDLDLEVSSNITSNLFHFIFPSQFYDSWVSDNPEQADINIQPFEYLSRGIQIKTRGLFMGNEFFL